MKTPSPLLWPFVCTALFSFAYNVACTASIVAITNRAIVAEALLSLSVPFITFVPDHLFVEVETIRRRLLMRLAVGLGYAAGGTSVLLFLGGQ